MNSQKENKKENGKTGNWQKTRIRHRRKVPVKYKTARMNSLKENKKENGKRKEENNRQGRELERQRENRKLENDEQDAKKKIPGNLNNKTSRKPEVFTRQFMSRQGRKIIWKI